MVLCVLTRVMKYQILMLKTLELSFRYVSPSLSASLHFDSWFVEGEFPSLFCFLARIDKNCCWKRLPWQRLNFNKWKYDDLVKQSQSPTVTYYRFKKIYKSSGIYQSSILELFSLLHSFPFKKLIHLVRTSTKESNMPDNRSHVPKESISNLLIILQEYCWGIFSLLIFWFRPQSKKEQRRIKSVCVAYEDVTL